MSRLCIVRLRRRGRREERGNRGERDLAFLIEFAFQKSFKMNPELMKKLRTIQLLAPKSPIGAQRSQPWHPGDLQSSQNGPKTSKLQPRGSQNGALEPSGLPKWSPGELQRPKNASTVQANNTPNLSSLGISNLHKFSSTLPQQL